MAMSEKINIAHLIGSLRIGGAERQVVSILGLLPGESFNRHVIVLNDTPGGFVAQLDEGVSYYSLEYRRRYLPFCLARLIKYLRCHRIEVLHCHMYHASIIGALAATVARTPVVVTTEHGRNPWKKRYHHWLEEKIISPAVQRRIAVSKDILAIRRQYDRSSGSKLVHIPNGTPLPPKQADCSAVRTIGSLGRLVDAKDYPTLFAALKLARTAGWDLKLVIAGDGPEKERLAAVIRKLELEEHIRLLGERNGAELLAGIDLFAMSSLREGIPVALLEAMAHGLPVVVTDVGGIGEVVEHGKDGLLCPPGDPEALAANIVKVVGDGRLRSRLGRSARNKIETRYSIAQVVSAHAALYRALLAERQVA